MMRSRMERYHTNKNTISKANNDKNKKGSNTSIDENNAPVQSYKRKLLLKASDGPNPTDALHMWIQDVVRFEDKSSGRSSAPQNITEVFYDDAIHVTVADLQDVVALAPAMVAARNALGLTPVHHALSITTNDEEEANDARSMHMLQTLLGVCHGKTLLATSPEGWTPLHRAASQVRSYDVFKRLVEAAGKAAPELVNSQQSKFRSRPFHLLCHNCLHTRADDRILHLLIDNMVANYHDDDEEHPLSVTDQGGRTPLHWAACIGASVSVLQKLVHLYPQALQCPTKRTRRIPLFEAAEHYETHSQETLQFLIDAWPQGIYHQSTFSRGILHYNMPEPILQYILSLWPQSLAASRGLLAQIGTRNFNARYTRFVLQRHPAAALEVVYPASGDTALHVAMRHAPSVYNDQFHEALAVLLGMCPVAAQRRNKQGWTPLHVALQNRYHDDCNTPNKNKHDPGTLRRLLVAYPEALYLPVATPWSSGNARHAKTIVTFFLEGGGNSSRIQELLWATCTTTVEENHGDVNSVSKNNNSIKNNNIPLMHILASHAAGHPVAFAKTYQYLCRVDSKTRASHGMVTKDLAQPVSAAVRHGGRGRLPLHVACAQAGCRAENLQVLLRLFEPALETEDEMGCLPLALALKANAPVEALYVLLRESPVTLERAVATL